MSAIDGARVALLFPGQGSQEPGMADPWLEEPAGREVLDRASSVLGWDVVERARDAAALERTELVQPALLACDLAAFAVLRALGASFHLAMGHSLGEYAALVASGALRLEDALRAVAVRADAMGRAADERPGTMTALLGPSLEEAREICEVAGRGDVVVVANENGPGQTVLSGSVAAVERAEEVARSRGARAVRLRVAGAFHSPLMRPALQPIRDTLSRLDVRTPEFPVVPNVSGKPTTNPLVLRDVLSRHVVSPVRWHASLRAAGEMGVTWFLEAGPGDVLSKLARRAVPGATARPVRSPDQARAVVEELRGLVHAGHTEETP